MKKEQTPGTTERPPLICYYCHRERHSTSCCMELQKDKDEGLVEQRGTNFFLPNGALIPFDCSRPIQHVVASYQPTSSSVPPRPSTPTRQASKSAKTEYKTSCGSLQPWYAPAVYLQSFADVYEANPAGKKRHEEPRPYKAPLVPSSQPKRPICKGPASPVDAKKDGLEEEPKLFNQIMNEPDPTAPIPQETPA
ncbi:hypothetical protein PTTG_02200 [Puccinia triticina 1-1 BBBD Race 1]|uniref:Uncharacterized protein n=1 Tax=Puccinia triticina (isolate 1-1 / race 1 (BBBD)) TaxID=630390 RepID=A0A0C4EN60_PUCT1|nr:hypothetical protein PTTG_02200 [Puccinia triticina 1-1 BBBD Race 1]